MRPDHQNVLAFIGPKLPLKLKLNAAMQFAQNRRPPLNPSSIGLGQL